MSVFEIIVLGLLQGLTEFIPVSSSGHLVIAHELFGDAENTLSFDVALHVGTLLALVIFFWRDIARLVTNVFNKTKDGKLARLIILATIPAALAGFLLEDVIDNNLRRLEVVAVTLVVVGLLMLLAEKYAKKRSLELDSKKALGIGVAQAVALIPGVSRSGASITAGMFAGLDRAAAARFSFLLAIPITAGSALGVLVKNKDVVSGSFGELVLGAAIAFISGLFAIKFLMSYLARHSLAVFAWYRFALAAAIALVAIIER